MCIARLEILLRLIQNDVFFCKLVLKDRSPISRIPNEILLHLFKYYLNPYDLFVSCIRVNKQWKSIIKDETIWKVINPINWAKGSISCLFIYRFIWNF